MKTFTEGSMLELLRSHCGGGRGGETAFITHVANGTGHSGHRRYCDALSMGLWPSSGLMLTGYEVKVTRADWQKEMQDPTKAEAFAKFCDYWYVAAPDGVVKPEELPASWGLVSPAGSGMKIRKPPEKRAPEPYSRNFLAALLRYSVRQSPASTELAKAVEAAEAAVRAEHEREKERARGRYSEPDTLAQLNELKERVRAFEEAAGMSLTGFGGLGRARELGQTVQQVLWLRGGKWHGLSHIAKDLRGFVDALDKAEVSIKALGSPHTEVVA